MREPGLLARVRDFFFVGSSAGAMGDQRLGHGGFLEAHARVTSSACSGDDGHRRGQPPRVVDGPQLADEAQRERVAVVGAGPREPQLDVARLDDRARRAAPVNDGDVGGDGEGDERRLARLQLDPGVADEAHDRPGHLGDRVVQVELHDLGAGPVAGVA